ncbi:hypothetical protein LTSERUB_2569, partial [Salmonella enterica subsp. enterica serovar Rubislaw str. A4-653]
TLRDMAIIDITPLANPIRAKPTTIAPVVISTGRNRIYNTIS